MNTQALIHSINKKLKGNVIGDVTMGSKIDIRTLDSIFERAGVSEEIETLKKRQFLRVTAFPGCNLRCSYCNPEGKFGKEVMSTPEILSILMAAYEIGIRTVHYTGGEPTEREDFLKLVDATKKLGIAIIDMTTNGTRLNQSAIINEKKFSSLIEALHASGLTGVSLSLDTLDPRTFKKMALAKDDELTDAEETLGEIKNAIETTCGLITIPGKFVVNMVVTKINFHEIGKFLAYAYKMNGGFIPRFCELQNRGPAFEEHQDRFFKEYVTRKQIIQALETSGMGKLILLDRESIDKQNAHAEYFELGKGGLIVGVVAPYSQGWPCAKGECKRMRIGPLGAVNSCLESPTFQLRNKSFVECKEIFRQMIYQKILRVITNDWPANHGTDYQRLRFGLGEL